MTTIYLPTLSRINATQVKFSLTPNTQVFESPLNKIIQTYELPGARWLFNATWQNLKEADARIFQAWIASLRGMAGRFYAYDLSHPSPRGAATGAGTVSGANQVGNSVLTYWTGVTNQSNWFLPGDYIGIGGELKIVTVASALSAHLSTVYFEPAIRTSPGDTSPVVISAPKATFRLNDDNQDAINIDPDRHPTISISATEVFS